MSAVDSSSAPMTTASQRIRFGSETLACWNRRRIDFSLSFMPSPGHPWEKCRLSVRCTAGAVGVMDAGGAQRLRARSVALFMASTHLRLRGCISFVCLARPFCEGSQAVDNAFSGHSDGKPGRLDG